MTERPKTQRAMVEQLWFVVIGSNGEGLVNLIKKTLERLERIERTIPALWTKEQHEEMHAKYVAQQQAEQAEKKEDGERRKISTRDWIMIAIVAAGIVIPFILERIWK